MYEQIFNLTSRPFTSTPYVKHYFPATAIDQSLQQCTMIIDRGTGPVVVVGDHGTGKTLLLAMLEESFQSRFRVVNLSVSVMRGRSDLLQNILFELKLNYRGLDEGEMRLGLVEYLKSKDEGSDGDGILLLVDDAQKLSREMIEELQLLSNFIQDGQPRVRLVLAGSRGIEDRLADLSLESFNQRIAGRCFLTCLGGEEIQSYVKAHLSRAGCEPDALFAEDAYRAIREVTEGRPRYINQVCDHAMIFSATRGLIPVNDSLVREAWHDIQQLPGSVAPTGSGASTSECPAVAQNHSLGESEGWTVLEFGELGDSDLQEFETQASPEVELFAESSIEEVQIEGADPFVDQPAEVETDAEEPQSTSMSAPSFSDSPGGESVVDADTATPAVPLPIPVKVDWSDSTEESSSSVISEVPTAVGGAAILASAMAGFGGTLENESTHTEFAEEQPLVAEPLQVQMVSDVVEEAIVPEERFEFEATIESESSESSDAVAESIPEAQTPSVAADPFAEDVFENEEVLADTYSPFVAKQNQRSLDVTTEQLQNLTPHDIVSAQPEDEPAAIQEEDSEENFPTLETVLQPSEPVRDPVKPTYQPRNYEETRHESELLGPDSLTDEFHVSRDAATTTDASLGQVSEVEISEAVATEPGSGFVPLDPDDSMVEAETESQSQNVEPTPTAPQPQSDIASFSIPQAVHAKAPVALHSASFVAAVSEESQLEGTSPMAAETPHRIDPSPIDPTITQEADSTGSVQGSFVRQHPEPEDAQLSEPQVEAPVASASQNALSESTQPSTAGFHVQASSPDDPDIRRQALEIIRQMGAGGTSEPVSHETDPALETVQQETNAIEDTIQRSIQARDSALEQQRAPQVAPIVMPEFEKIQQSLQQAQEAQANTPVPSVQPIPVQMASEDSIEPERRILEEIQDQSAMLPDQIAAPPTLPYPPQQPVAGHDDRDILEVNQEEEQHPVAAAQALQASTMPEWSQQEPSQGEAARVDYQKLFDQLRNVQSNQE